MPVYQLVYLSAESAATSDQDLRKILAASRRNNEKLGVTGMLLYDAGSFIQALEGDEPVVDELFDRISNDPRHNGATVLLRGTVAQRDFGQWSMGFHHVGVDPLPGINDFMETGFEGPSARLTVVHKAFAFFREGHWRQAEVGGRLP